MTSTTAAAAALTDGEHLVHRPRGVVHLYRGPLTASGRYAKRGPACGQRTNRLQVLEAPTEGALDPGWTRRLCQRCEPLLAAPAVPMSRADWAPWAELTLPQLAVDLSMAVTVEEIDRVAFLALIGPGYAAAAAPLPGRTSDASLLKRIELRRRVVDVEAAEAERARWDRSRAIQNRSKVGRARDAAAEAQRLAERTGNSVDRLRATETADRADRLARRHATAV